MDLGEEELVAGQGDAVRHAHVAQVPAGAAGGDGLHHRGLVAHGLDDAVRAVAAGELLDLRGALVATLGDDDVGAELAGERRPVLVAGEGDDLLSPQGLGGQDGGQAHGAVADHRDGLAGAGLGGDGPEPAGSQDVGGGQQRGDDLGVLGLAAGNDDEGSVGQGHARVLGLGVPDEAAVGAARLEAVLADLAGVVAQAEGADDEVADLDVRDLVADLDDGAHVLVAHGAGLLHGGDAPVGPQVRAAHAGGLELDDGVGGLDDVGDLAVLDTDVSGGVHDDAAHRGGQGGSRSSHRYVLTSVLVDM